MATSREMAETASRRDILPEGFPGLVSRRAISMIRSDGCCKQDAEGESAFHEHLRAVGSVRREQDFLIRSMEMLSVSP